MSEQNQTTAPKIYESKVLLNWETPERKGNIVFQSLIVHADVAHSQIGKSMR